VARGRGNLNKTPTAVRSLTANVVRRTAAAIRLPRLQFLKNVMTPQFGVLVTNSLLNSHRPSTQNQYQHCWTKFQNYLIDKNIQAIRLKTVLQFLIYLVNQENLSVKSLPVYRSSLDLPLKYGFSISTKSREFNLLSRSQFISNPPLKVATPEWELDKVLNLLEQPRFIVNISDEDLMLKTLFLVALATGNRASELSAITRNSINFSINYDRVKLSVKPGFLYKNERMGRTPPDIIVKSLNEGNMNSSHPLCPVNSLRTYLERTKNYHSESLFVDCKSKKALPAPRISFFLCKLINLADPGTFPKGHDVRKMSSSLAWTR